MGGGLSRSSRSKRESSNLCNGTDVAVLPSENTRADFGGLDRGASFGADCARVLQICESRPMPSDAGLVVTRELLSKDCYRTLNLWDSVHRAQSRDSVHRAQSPWRSTGMNPARIQSRTYEVIHPLTLRKQTINTKLLKRARAVSLCTFGNADNKNGAAVRRLLAKFAQAPKPSGRVGKIFLLDAETGHFSCCYFWENEASMHAHLSSGESTAGQEIRSVQEYRLVLEKGDLMADEESTASTASCSTTRSSSPAPSLSTNINNILGSSTAAERATHRDVTFGGIAQEVN